MATAAASMGGTSSNMLSCLDNLDDDAWQCVLLPLLLQHSSTRPLSMTCQQMRTICHRHHTRLNLSALTACCGPHQAEACTSVLPARFPNVLSVDVQVGSDLLCDTSYRSIAAVMPALARFSKLESLNVTVLGPVNSINMGLLLSNLRMLPRLKALSFNLDQSWANAKGAWQELGRLTQLTSLEIAAPQQQLALCRIQDLAALQNLVQLKVLHVDTNFLVQPPPEQNLQELLAGVSDQEQLVQQHTEQLRATCAGTQKPQHDVDLYLKSRKPVLQQLALTLKQSERALATMRQDLAVGQQLQQQRDIFLGSESLAFLQHLTELTSIKFPVPTGTGLEHMAACNKLHQVLLLRVNGRKPALEPHIWSSIEQLTGLTRLSMADFVVSALEPAKSTAFHKCLAQLSQLHRVDCYAWSLEVLPTFAELQHLETVEGGWMSSAQDFSGISCPSVTQSCWTFGAVPFKAFPSLQSIHQGFIMTPTAFKDMCTACPFISRITTRPGAVEGPPNAYQYWSSLGGVTVQHADLPFGQIEPGGEVEEHVDAITSLTCLQQLTAIDFHASQDAELAALIVLPIKLRKLRIRAAGLDYGGSDLVTSHGVILLSDLPVECFILHTLNISFTPAAISMLLNSLHCTQEVIILAADTAEAGRWRLACRQLAAKGLRGGVSITVHVGP